MRCMYFAGVLTCARRPTYLVRVRVRIRVRLRVGVKVRVRVRVRVRAADVLARRVTRVYLELKAPRIDGQLLQG